MITLLLITMQTLLLIYIICLLMVALACRALLFIVVIRFAAAATVSLCRWCCKTLFKVYKFGLWSHVTVYALIRYQLGQIVFIHIGKVVKIAILLCHGCKLTGLDGCFGGCLGEELWIDIADVRDGLDVGHERRVHLFHIHLIPVNWSEKGVGFKLYTTCLPTTYSFLRVFLQYLS